jgi:hypothetical protein
MNNDKSLVNFSRLVSRLVSQFHKMKLVVKQKVGNLTGRHLSRTGHQEC